MKIDYPDAIKPSDLDQFLFVFKQLADDKISYIEYIIPIIVKTIQLLIPIHNTTMKLHRTGTKKHG